MLKSFVVELNRLAEGLISSEKKFCFASLASLRLGSGHAWRENKANRRIVSRKDAKDTEFREMTEERSYER